jgi:peroxiredoxin
MRQLLFAIAAAMSMLVLPARARAQEAGIAVGAAAPGAAVETLDGRTVDLGTYLRGKPAVLEFWATWCPLCKQLEAPLQTARTKYAGKVTFVSVGVRDNQTREKQRAYAEEHRLGGELVFDRDGKAVAAYQVPHTSYLVVVDAHGKIVYTGVGADQDVEAAIATAFKGDAMGDAMGHGSN